MKDENIIKFWKTVPIGRKLAARPAASSAQFSTSGGAPNSIRPRTCFCGQIIYFKPSHGKPCDGERMRL